MGVLDSVLEYKARKEAQEAQAAQAIPMAVQAFITGRQQQIENQNSMLNTQINAAKAGFRIDGGQLVQDPSLMGGSNLLRQQKLQAEIDTTKTKNRLYESMLGDVTNPNKSQNLLDEAVNSSGMSQEDFIVKPITRMVAGVPHTAYVPEMKPQIPAGARKIIDEINPVKLGLKQNLRFIEENPAVKKFMTPADIRAHKGGSFTGFLGNMLMKVDSNKDTQAFGVFKAETDKIFQKFRKETTGAQAAMAELGWLAPDFPEADDSPELYKGKAVEALKRIDEGMDMLLKNYSAQGYRTSEIRKALMGDGSSLNQSSPNTNYDQEKEARYQAWKAKQLGGAK